MSMSDNVFEHSVVGGDCVFKDVRQCFEIIVMIRIIISLAQKIPPSLPCLLMINKMSKRLVSWW